MRRFMGLAMLPQAGVAIGMALVAISRLPEYREPILAVVISSTIIFELFGPVLTRLALGWAGEAGKAERFDTAVSVLVFLDDDLERARLAAKPMLSLYIGGMGAKGKNFYHDLAHRYGYGEAADRIQESYLAGHKMEARRAVPDDLGDEVSLVGSRERIADRLEVWKESDVTTLIAATTDLDTVRTLAELML